MHTAAFRALGLNFVYVAFGTDDTAGAIAAMRALCIRGLGITTPHKLRVADFLDRIEDTARHIGAVNTVVNDDGRLTGHNVDWIGAQRAIGEAIDPAGRHAIVVGAGGGARAIAYGLIAAGARVSIFNRNEERGRRLAAALGARFAGGLDKLAAAEPFDLLVHATPVGFHAPEATLIPPAVLRPGIVVFDAVAVPPETRLLRDAAACGCRTVAGVRMQLHQAACQFELYTGRAPDLAVMEAALHAAIAAV